MLGEHLLTEMLLVSLGQHLLRNRKTVLTLNNNPCTVHRSQMSVSQMSHKGSHKPSKSVDDVRGVTGGLFCSRSLSLVVRRGQG